MEFFIRHIEVNFLKTTLKKGIVLSIIIYGIFIFYHAFISFKLFLPLLIAFAAYIVVFAWLFWLFQKKKYNLSRILFLYSSVLFFAITSFVLVGTETNNHYYILIFSVLAIWMNPKESFFSIILFFSITLFLFIAAEFSLFPDIAIIDYPEKLLKGEAIQNVVFTFLIIFYVSYLFNKASIKKEIQLAEKTKELHEANARLEDSRQEIAKKNEALILTNKTKDKLFNIISHDIKNPLSSLRGLIEVLNLKISKNKLDGIDPLINGINISANRLQTLTLGLLDWSRTQIGGIAPEKSTFQLLKIIYQNKELFTSALNEKNIELKIDCDPNINIFSDYNMLNTVVRNLVNNAIKFTYPEGKIQVVVSEFDAEYSLSVKDNGIGMSAEKLNNLFDFNKASSTYGTSDEIGSGLGLLLCYEFLKLNNCTLNVESQEGKGSTFTIQIPK